MLSNLQCTAAMNFNITQLEKSNNYGGLFMKQLDLEFKLSIYDS
jgi:hypothetical protein